MTGEKTELDETQKTFLDEKLKVLLREKTPALFTYFQKDEQKEGGALYNCFRDREKNGCLYP